MKNKRELIKGMSDTYWEIIRHREGNKNNVQYTTTWSFSYDQVARIVRDYKPTSIAYATGVEGLYCKLKGNVFEFGTGIESFEGKINKNQMLGNWKNTNGDTGGFIGILLNSEDKYKNRRSLKEEVFYQLWYRKAGDWLLSNWNKIVTYIDDKIAKISTTYTNRCWSCHHGIKSTKHEYRFIEKLLIKWNGNQKCEVPNCNYFLCNECHKCLCHPNSPFRHNYNRVPITRKWVDVNKRQLV